MNVQMTKKIVYYFSNPTRGGTGEILMGLPEQFAAPVGYEKIVCNTAREAELWSGRLRVWEGIKEEIGHLARKQRQQPIRESIMSEMRHNMANARNNINKDFMRRAIEKADKATDPLDYRRESMLHAEGYEKGK